MNMFREFISKYSTVFGKAIITAFAAAIVAIVLINPINTLVTYLVTNKAPQVVVRQYYNTVNETAAVPNRVGDLTIEYQTPKIESKGVYVIAVANEGRAPEENLRVQAKFPANTTLSYYKEEPDFRVYQQEEAKLDTNGFFMALKSFPTDAFASISFVPPENTKTLCKVNLKAAGKLKEGKVEAIEGLQCE